MSNLSSIEKIKLEKIFEMGGGYILDFSNRTFQEFILDNCGIDIYDIKYDYGSGSKANRLRAFWSKEPNQIVGKLIFDLLDYWTAQKTISSIDIKQAEQNLLNDCYKISERLLHESLVENIESIQSYSDDKDFSLLSKSIRESIAKNEPEAALDRLHTYTVKYLRQLCDKHSIDYHKETPLHSLFGGYVKYLMQNKIIESEMTERILKSSISILESFNIVRNEQSFAHDNPILNYNESILIFSNIATSIKFIDSIENFDPQTKLSGSEPPECDDIPF
jgi:hypothetical protein